MTKKSKLEKFDGFNDYDKKRVRTALRQVWSWSHSRRLCVKRATDKKGFGRCEKCKNKVPKVFPDHIQRVGDIDGDVLKRLFVPSKFLQALCKKCHDAKTREERRAALPDPCRDF